MDRDRGRGVAGKAGGADWDEKSFCFFDRPSRMDGNGKTLPIITTVEKPFRTFGITLQLQCVSAAPFSRGTPEF